MPKIRVETELHDQFRRLGGDQQLDDSPGRTFATMKDVFMIATVLGVRAGVRTPVLHGKDIFDDDALKTRDWNLLAAIALSESNDINNLENVSEILRVAQEYANTGIRILRDQVEPKEAAQSIAQLILQ